jgi:hypothetical protein
LKGKTERHAGTAMNRAVIRQAGDAAVAPYADAKSHQGITATLAARLSRRSGTEYWPIGAFTRDGMAMPVK